MKKTVFPVLLIALGFALILTSCDDFFGASWGSAREYDKSKVSVNAGNVEEWIDRAIGDPGLADAVSDAIIDELEKDKSNPHLGQGDKNALSNAGMELAVESSGLGESLVKHATKSLTDLLEEEDDADADATEEKFKEILGKIQSDFKAANGAKAADNIAKIVQYNILDGTAVDGEAPQFDPAYTADVSPGVLGESIIVLAMGVLGDRSMDDWNNIESIAEGLTFDTDNKYVIIDDHLLVTPSALALAACFNLIVDDPEFQDDPITGAIYDAFSKSNN